MTKRTLTRSQNPPHDVAIEFEGVRHVGTYTVDRGVIEVQYRGKRKSMQVGNMPPDMLAEMLLAELVGSALQRPPR